MKVLKSILFGIGYTFLLILSSTFICTLIDTCFELANDDLTYIIGLLPIIPLLFFYSKKKKNKKLYKVIFIFETAAIFLLTVFALTSKEMFGAEELDIKSSIIPGCLVILAIMALLAIQLYIGYVRKYRENYTKEELKTLKEERKALKQEQTRVKNAEKEERKALKQEQMRVKNAEKEAKALEVTKEEVKAEEVQCECDETSLIELGETNKEEIKVWGLFVYGFKKAITYLFKSKKVIHHWIYLVVSSLLSVTGVVTPFVALSNIKVSKQLHDNEEVNYLDS